ncbi:MAG: hypothetical protein ILP12_06595 [Lachnospiraceae bacterium]|nr:hypothetical protein [Lachnospiraceae bacterium]
MKKKREILIELTPLLDVILIMIFVLLTRAGTQTETAKAQAADEALHAQAMEQQRDEALEREAEAVLSASAAYAELQQVREESESRLKEMQEMLDGEREAMQQTLEAERREAREQMAAAEEREKALEIRVGEAQDERDLYKRQVITQGIVIENSLVVTISVARDRSIRLEKDGELISMVAYTWGSETYPYNVLRSNLFQILDGCDALAIFLVFQYDRSVIYASEYDMIFKVLQDIKLQFAGADLPLNMIEIDTHS